MGEFEGDIYVRCTSFAENTLAALRQTKPDYIDRVIIVQLVRSSTSVAANMMEASESVSKRDFVNKLGIALKEAKESEYWANLLSRAHPEAQGTATEADELVKVLATIKRKYLVGSSVR